MVHHPLENNQRATDDVLLRVHFNDGTSLVHYATSGIATYLLARYTRDRFNLNPAKAYAWVEPVQMSEQKEQAR